MSTTQIGQSGRQRRLVRRQVIPTLPIYLFPSFGSYNMTAVPLGVNISSCKLNLVCIHMEDRMEANP